MDMKHIVSSFSPVNLWTKTVLWAYCRSSWIGQFSTQRHRCCHRCYVWRLHMLSVRSEGTNWLMTSKQQCCCEVWQEMWNHGCSCGWMTKLRFLNCVNWSWPLTSRLQDGLRAWCVDKLVIRWLRAGLKEKTRVRTKEKERAKTRARHLGMTKEKAMETPRDTTSLPIPKEKADKGKRKTKNSGKDTSSVVCHKCHKQGH